ncbi:MAG TPA: metal-dependent transcriptional regulator [Propionicimonas sp.]|nr:metal-dependent transcriptional regulator [Propionicimonas sp.]
MSELIDTTEMYLRTIYELIEEGVPPLRARIAERLKQSGPTVSQTVARMERDGLVSVHPDRHLELSDVGLARAVQVMRRHRLAERLLTDVIGLDWPLVHDEACRWEHVISTDVERRLVEVLHAPTESPYGNPIPAIDERGGGSACDAFLGGAQVLAETLGDGGEHVVVLKRLSEALQADAAVLQVLAEVGMLPGREVGAAMLGRMLVLRADGRQVSLPATVADQIFVAA